GLFPREVGRLRHELISLHDRDLAEAAEVRLVAPDALIRREHRVVVRGRILVVDVIAVHGDRVARLPVANGRADAQHDTGGVAPEHVVRLVVAGTPDALATAPGPGRGGRG